ncbi:MAG TPA: beta-ketoacyl synthase N-terminal-like domain-containing protein [Bacillota bacterium]|nr:beta-ketoacyl synthase N-terminal-like domain-containing protein [Bacillota bacterium]HOL08574.1 beta-ketoacyl synthase N-terminal-like domain-containing protein [Bacillota bacterium]HPO97812.1 beta-ketoacyl synthase N-terminal-like domain-containing protein [Bacillota bacterium]
MKLNRVVVTGFGAVSPYGSGVEALFDGVFSHRSGISNLGEQWRESIADIMCEVGGLITADLNERQIPREMRRNMGRVSILACLSAKEAVQMAGLTSEHFNSGDYGVSFASTTGSSKSVIDFTGRFIQEKSLSSIKAGQFFQVMSHTAATNIACLFNIKGRVISPNSACSSAAQSIGLAYETIKFGLQKGMICGGAEELHVSTSATFDLLQAASYHYNDRPNETPRPFDQERDGTVCGEGSGALVIESEASAKERGAKILGEIIGFSTFASGEHMSRVTEREIIIGLERLFRENNISLSDIDYINAHGTGTILGDIEESLALEDVFTKKGYSPYVSSLKGHFGHTLGASAALESIVCFEMLNRECLVPTKNLENPDERCGKINYLTDFKKLKIDLVMKNSFAFGGINAILLLRRYTNGD